MQSVISNEYFSEELSLINLMSYDVDNADVFKFLVATLP